MNPDSERDRCITKTFSLLARIVVGDSFSAKRSRGTMPEKA